MDKNTYKSDIASKFSYICKLKLKKGSTSKLRKYVKSDKIYMVYPHILLRALSAFGNLCSI